MSEDSESTEQQQPWSSDARDYTLAAIDVVRELKGGTEEYGPEFGQAEVLEEVKKQVQRFGGSVDADGLASVAVGLTRLSEMLLSWIQNEADKKKVLLADVREKLPDYDEPDTYPAAPDWPNWSTWKGVLIAIENVVRNSPTAD
ncbi:Uncharacterised protein [Mycolicibacterium aurum]|uniref:Uncharacterized protein n=2 Tax=Mycolicibacterium aurum TaxID=1791 RepID=A0A3S4VY70_MYCAU|nr:hypothetical protein [Mycolicibacterium aurum]VEG58143.1 Uncharacterised protein [Mycolicibacterium aurum]